VPAGASNVSALTIAAPALEWYQRMFGGEINKLKGRIDGILYGKVWLLAEGRWA
jgi:hypothetical protein